MKRAMQAKLVAAWHGLDTCAAIAVRYGLAEITVRKFWERARGDGRLPASSPRPFFTQNCTPLLEADGIGDDRDIIAYSADGEPIEGGPLGGPIGLAIPPGDPLLCGLRLVHGHEPWRPLDGMPAEVLRIEAAGAMPSRSRLAYWAQLRDAFAGALLVLREARA